MEAKISYDKIFETYESNPQSPGLKTGGTSELNLGQDANNRNDSAKKSIGSGLFIHEATGKNFTSNKKSACNAEKNGQAL